jgi:hypothetical protein
MTDGDNQGHDGATGISLSLRSAKGTFHGAIGGVANMTPGEAPDAWKPWMDSFLQEDDAQPRVNANNIISIPKKDFKLSGLIHILDAIIRDQFRDDHIAALEEARSAFTESLDQGALEHSKLAPKHLTASIYSWLAAGGDKKKAAVRRQALESYPLLISHLVNKEIDANNTSRWRPFYAAHRRLAMNESQDGPVSIIKAIDAEIRLEPVISEVSGLPISAIKSLIGISGEDDPGRRILEFVENWKKDMKLPHSHWPNPRLEASVASQWRSLVKVADFCNVIATNWDYSDPPLTPGAVARLAAERPFWLSSQQMEKYNNLDGQEGSLSDVTHAFAKNVLLPLAIDAAVKNGHDLEYQKLMEAICEPRLEAKEDYSMAKKILVNGRSVPRLLELSGRWHKNERRMDAEVVEKTDPRCWPPLLESPIAYGELTAMSLCSPGDLGEEGARLEHCVGTYAAHCLYDGSHIISIRNKSGESLSTMEIRISEQDGNIRMGHPKIVIRQHYGHKNSDPSKAEKELASWLLKGLSDGSIPFDWGKIKDERKIRESNAPSKQDEMAEIIGYDYQDTSIRDFVLNQWQFALPPDQRGLSHAEWAKSLGIPEMLDAHFAQLEKEVSQNP